MISILKFTRSHSSLIKYLIVGATSFAIEFAAFGFFLCVISFQALVANALSLVAAFTFNFTMSNFWTFKAGRNNVRRKIVRYIALVVTNYLLNNSIFYLLNTLFKIDPVVTKIVVTGLQVIWTYLAYNLWVFKN